MRDILPLLTRKTTLTLTIPNYVKFHYTIQGWWAFPSTHLTQIDFHQQVNILRNDIHHPHYQPISLHQRQNPMV